MKMEKVIILAHLVTIFIVFHHVQSSPTAGDINWWCNQTPYPEPCKFHMNNSEPSSAISRKQFLTMAEETALEEVTSALEYIKSLEPRVINDAERSAWSTCVRFYNLTEMELNKVVDVTTKSTPNDIQIWLTAASTNIYSCNDGFSEVNVTTNIYPLVSSNNVTQLITNCQAINKAFPEDVSRSSILQNPDGVVARDDSNRLQKLWQHKLTG